MAEGGVQSFEIGGVDLVAASAVGEQPLHQCFGALHDSAFDGELSWLAAFHYLHHQDVRPGNHARASWPAAKHAETVAEFIACVLMHLYGYGDYSGNAWHYIAALHPDPVTALYKALSSIERVLDLILAE